MVTNVLEKLVTILHGVGP